MLNHKDGILLSTGRFDSSAKFKCEDVEMDLPFYDDSRIAPVVMVVRERSLLFHFYTLFIRLKVRPHSGVETTMKELHKKMFVLGLWQGLGGSVQSAEGSGLRLLS